MPRYTVTRYRRKRLKKVLEYFGWKRQSDGSYVSANGEVAYDVTYALFRIAEKFDSGRPPVEDRGKKRLQKLADEFNEDIVDGNYGSYADMLVEIGRELRLLCQLDASDPHVDDDDYVII